MIPFRELEIFDSFMLDGRECEKIGHSKYLTYDALGEPRSLDSAEPNMMVEMIEEKMIEEEENNDDLHDYFFSTLISMIEAMERAGETMTIKELKKLAITSLAMGRDS